jgi:type IV pilus assembly protein PilY1
MSAKTMSVRLLQMLATAGLVSLSGAASAAPLNIVEAPLFLNGVVAPLNLLVVGRDHKLYYEAYNDASDLDGDGTLDTRYKGYELKSPAPAAGSDESIYKIDYYGYFDSYKCYSYTNNRFEPTEAVGALKTCGNANDWSGDYLNYLTTSRIDALRKVLYGGDRKVDSTTETVLERSYITQDAHSWGKEYDPIVDDYNIADYSPLSDPSVAGRRHFFANTTPRGTAGSTSALYDDAPLLRYVLNIGSTVRIWNWLSRERPVAHRASDAIDGLTLVDGDFHDLNVRVKVCVSGLLEKNCKAYTDAGGTVRYKPIGIIQDYGDGTNPRMYFGLMTGSYSKNTSGGVLRRRMGEGTTPLANEISQTTGQFLDFNGIIRTFNRLHPAGFNSGYEYGCGWADSGGPIAEGRCQMWGNPIAEIMYEGLRYLGGKTSATADFATAFGAGDESQLPGGGLPVDSSGWGNGNDPYANQPRCAKPFETVISDINPSYDSDQLPGSAFGSTISSDLPGSLDVSALGQTIWNNELGAGTHKIFIGHSLSNAPAYDNAPTVKDATSFGNIRGLAPEEPTKRGSYYSASVAYHGNKTDIHATKPGDQKVTTFAVALASPLPKIDIPVNGRTVTLIPFAKSPGGSVGSITYSPDVAQFQPTNQIVDFYVDTLTSTYGKFRVNFEDVEQGADHDMDAIVVYEYTVNGSNVDIKLTSSYAAGSIQQHMGYVISGTTRDGTYLEVRDADTTVAADVDYFLDTPPLFAGPPPATSAQWDDNIELPLITTRTFTAGASPGASLLKNPLWYAAKWGGFKDGNNNNLPDQTSEWDEDNDGDPDNYFLVTNALTLGTQLSKAFEDILQRVGSASSASVNAGSISSETRVYQAKFNSGDWSGQLLSFPVVAVDDPATTTVNEIGTLAPAEWDASERLPAPGSRTIITTRVTGAGATVAVPFRWADIRATNQALLNQSPDTLGQDRLNYIRGDDAREFRNGGQFRDRRRTPLGDIVASSPTFVGPPNARLPDTLESVRYSTFVTAQASRTKMVYAGANDGMLHGFNATTGSEMLAFIPKAVFPNLRDLTRRNYSHKYYVDGTPSAADVFYSGGWHTVLVGGLNRGGKSMYALDITSPSTFSEANATSIYKWEFTDPDLGYTYSRPAIVRMHNGDWAAVFGSGYNNNTGTGTGRAFLFVVRIRDGALIRKIDTGVGDTTTPNGLATPAVIDLNGDSIVDYAYAGDLRGNLWKFNLTSTDPNSWGIPYPTTAGARQPLFTATDGAATPVAQPITSRPEVSRGPNGRGTAVFFGTGKFLELVDKTPGGKQTFYAIYDPNTNTDTDLVASRASLTQQSILVETTFGTQRARVTSNNAITSGSRGWFMDLVSPGPTLRGEMQVSNSILRNGRVIFTTLIPDPDVCAAGGTSWLMELDSLTGSRLEAPPFDLNGDNQFNNDDMVGIPGPAGTTIYVNVSGLGSEVGITGTPGVLTNVGGGVGGGGGGGGGGNGTQEFKYLSGSASSASGSNLQRVVENPGVNTTGRQSWRQIK